MRIALRLLLSCRPARLLFPIVLFGFRLFPRCTIRVVRGLKLLLFSRLARSFLLNFGIGLRLLTGCFFGIIHALGFSVPSETAVILS
ncbi:MAG: hypothetical protein ABI680_13715, partial [Chthoniobacteraceae bacterium]